MNKVRDDLNRLKAEESARHNASYRMLLAGAAGPDGGMAAMDCYRSQVNYTGKWNTKTVEDYISMVKAELKRQHITVDAVMEKKMVDHLIKEQIPKSTAEYITRKAMEGTLFNIPNRSRASLCRRYSMTISMSGHCSSVTIITLALTFQPDLRIMCAMAVN